MFINVTGKLKPGDMCPVCKSSFYLKNGILKCACSGVNNARK